MATALSNFALDIVVVGEQDVWADNDQRWPSPIAGASRSSRSRVRHSPQALPASSAATPMTICSVSLPTSAHTQIHTQRRRRRPQYSASFLHILEPARASVNTGCSTPDAVHLGVANERYVLDIAQ